MDVADRATAAKFAAFHLLNALDEGRDEAGLFAFDSRLREVAPFTVDTRALQGALGEVDPFGATSLHDAIAETAKRIQARANSRRAIVVSHWIINAGFNATFGAQGQAIYDGLKGNTNLFLMLSGHVSPP